MPIAITDGVARAVIRPELGAGIERYDLLSPAVPLFDSAPRPGPAPFQLACNLLLPWSGRISGGGFSFGGRFHALSPNLEGEALPIHGNGFCSPWTPVASGHDWAELSLDSEGPGPYRYAATVRYALAAGALTMTLAVTNRATISLPYGLGFHPWFPRTPRTTLRFAARTVWFEDSRHLPAGSAPVAVHPDWDYSAGRMLPEGWLHGWFSDWDGTATITWPERGVTLEISAPPPLGCCVLYSPSADAGFFCFEPVSHPVDAHNLPGGAERSGLVVLEPSAAVQANCQFSPAQ